jgi:hypothetical protein
MAANPNRRGYPNPLRLAIRKGFSPISHINFGMNTRQNQYLFRASTAPSISIGESRRGRHLIVTWRAPRAVADLPDSEFN